ncbi:hypothetical protein [Actinomadura alba]|uniref:Uncharacterized protein n=1 Tax=Actinomadura alba TaxID=406431 RepID=A0ABR7LZ73_9ACTN|nr:hypothetical protein [Actinomadura alba]MBC6470164.1 hypothetical protein [Actinomadura alba]
MILWYDPPLWWIPEYASAPDEHGGPLTPGPGGRRRPGDAVRPGCRRSSRTAGPYDPRSRRGGAVEPPAPEEPPAPPRPEEVRDRSVRSPPRIATAAPPDLTKETTAVPPPVEHLSDQQRQAIDLADRLRHRLGHWLARRGIITATFGISPYVDPAGRPSALVCMNDHAAEALLLALDDGGATPSRHGCNGR